MKRIARASYLVALFCGGTACSKAVEKQAVEPSAEVTLVPAVVGALTVTITGYGVVEFDPTGLRTITSELEGRVIKIDTREGDSVPEGAVLLELRPSEVTSIEIGRTRRDAITAAAAAARARRLRADGLASDADVEAAATTATNLTALADSLEQRAANVSTLRAPMASFVDAILVEAGDLVASGAPLARLSTGAIQATIRIETEDAVRIAIGAPVRLKGLGNAGLSIDTAIRAIDFRVHPATRMASVSVPVATGKGLLPGQAVRAEITAEVKHNVVVVPRQAVLTDELGSFVFVAANGRAALRRVEPGLTSGASTEIAKGVAAGDDIIVEGASTLSDRMQVRTVPPLREGR